MQRSKTGDLASHRWRSILPALGVESRCLVNKHGPCPVCEGRDRFRFDDQEGRGTWICNKCGSGDGIELVKLFRGVDFKAACALIDPLIGAAEVEAAREDVDEDQVRRSMKQLGQRSAPVEPGDPVHRYLVSRVGSLAVPSCLRTVPSCLYKDEDRLSYHPAMLASVRDLQGRSVGLHRTYLTADGRKADLQSVRKVLGKLPDGCAVRLGEAAPTMGVAEGIETALSASAMFNMPVWATLNSGRLKVWQPPPDVLEVIIFGDNDISCDGQEAAYALGRRLNRTIVAQVSIPHTPGTDWNDVHQAKLRGSRV